MNVWPKQSECDAFYGNPRGKHGPSVAWESANLVRLTPPWQMTYAGKPIKSIRVHRKCVDSLARVFASIAKAASFKQDVLDRWGVSEFGGTYNYRLIRGSTRLSMHAYGCAIDLDPTGNALGDKTPEFKDREAVRSAFAAEGWVWGGNWSRPDGMHWQAARI